MNAPRQPARSRVEQESASAQQGQPYRDPCTMLPAIAHATDAEGRLLGVSDRWLRTFGYARDEVIGCPATDFMTPESRDWVRSTGMPEFLRTGQAQDLELQMICKDGAIVDVLLSAVLEREAHSYPLRSLSVMQDVTAQKRDLSDRRRQQTLIDRVIELTPCAIVLVDPRGSISLCNAQAERIFGYPREELLGMTVEELLPQAIRSAHKGLRAGFLRSPSARQMGIGQSLLALRSDGSEFPVEVGLSPIETAAGPAVLAAIIDITVSRQQQAAVETALAEKETLLKEVYHRVKNNLQVVQSMMSLHASTQTLPSTRDAFLECTLRVRAMALVHEKLYQSRKLSSISLSGYVRDLTDQLIDATGVDRRRVRLNLAVSDMEVALDSAIPLGLLLTELVTNCFKHAFPKGRVGRVELSLSPVDDGPLLVVADDGVGFPTSIDAFEHPSMGMQLARGLAAQLGGELLVESAAAGTRISAKLRQL